MPKQLQIDPDQTYAADHVRFHDIPVHAYRQDSDAERARWGDDRLREALRTIAAAVKLAPPPPFPPACPFTILWGVSDSIVPPPDLPTPGLRLLPDVGHMPQVEAAGEVVEAIRERLEGPLP